MAIVVQDSAFLERWGLMILLLILIGVFASALLACYAVATALYQATQKEPVRWGGMAGARNLQVSYAKFTTVDYIEKTAWVFTEIWNYASFSSKKPGMLRLEKPSHLPIVQEKQRMGIHSFAHNIKQDIIGGGVKK